jgi:hypothetical protein
MADPHARHELRKQRNLDSVAQVVRERPAHLVRPEGCGLSASRRARRLRAPSTEECRNEARPEFGQAIPPARPRSEPIESETTTLGASSGRPSE